MATVAEQISYEDLYSRWERGNWAATELDFSEDRRQWREELDDLQRRSVLWHFALFLHGEEAVAETLSPYIDAAPLPEQKHFLTTQQVDESRHAVFFARFMAEVVGQGKTVEETMARTNAQLTPGFRKVFGRLDRMAGELRRDPSPRRLAAGVTLYHLLIEASLAQPGQHIIESSFDRLGILPGFVEGMRRVANDEQRHIAFGMRLLADLIADDPGCTDAMAAMLREVLPWVLAVPIPPGWDEGYTGCFGFTLEDIYTEAQRSFESKLRAAGLTPGDLHGAVPWSVETPYAERAQNILAMLRANLLGAKTGPPGRDAAAVEALFDSVRLSLDDRHVPPGRTTIQWEFEDFEPWHLVVDNGSSAVARGRVEQPDLALRCQRFEDWVDIFAGREDPRLAMLKRRVRPSGSMRMLLRSQRFFGSSPLAPLVRA